MASTAFQSTTGGTSNSIASSIPASTFTPAEVSSKPTYISKLGSTKGRQSENTAGAVSAQRQSSASKAWVSGMNPLTQRPSNLSQRNGTTHSTQSAMARPNTIDPPEGSKMKVTLENGAEFEGIVSSVSDISYTLKMVQQKRLPIAGDMANGNNKMSREQAHMSFRRSDLVDAHVTGAPLPVKGTKRLNGNTGFRTDAAISGNKFQGERPLKPWVADGTIETHLSLESTHNRTSTGPVWDQFEANNRLFGLTTDYNENIYTTTIDKSHPDYQRRYAEADKKAREIEVSVTDNAHIAEERITDNLTLDDSGLNEEDKYSGVQKHDFPPLSSSVRINKYTPPARRSGALQPTSTISLTDPAIISSSLARKESPSVDKANTNLNTQTSNTSQAAETEVEAPVATMEAKVEPKPQAASEATAPSANISASASRTASPQIRTVGAPNATATVERDVVSAFKGFAAQQRVQADKLRSSKARADKEVKLYELKKFAASFKLNSPVPSDLVSIIAKDPAKQREIQEKAKRNAEEQAEQAKQAKANSAEVATAVSPNSELKTARRGGAAPTQSGVSTSGGSGRQNPGRTPSFPSQSPYNSQSFRGDRSVPVQPMPTQNGRLVQGPGLRVSPNPVHNGRPVQGLGARLRSLEQSKNGQLPLPSLSHEGRPPPTGPANSGEPNFSRRSSGAINMMGAKLNPNSNEFRPSPFAATFNPSGNPSSGSSPRSNSAAANQLVVVPSTSLIRRKPLQTPEKASTGDSSKDLNDLIESIAMVQPPSGVERKWESNGGIKPAYDTLPTWRQLSDQEPTGSSMHQTYAKLFESAPYPNQAMSPPQPSHVNPQVAHQHQLPFHLQQVSHTMSQRHSPRQPPMHLHNNQHNHGPSAIFNPTDEHRMMPSHSAQSFASPRLQAVNMSYPSPMGQPAQLAYTQPCMQYPIGPGAPQMAQYRSYSGGHQFVPQPTAHLGGPVMIPAPAANGFMGPAGMISPAPQMIYPGGQTHFVPQGNGPPPMAGTNGYPSPGRSAPMMMTGSQQGQSVYGMSPGMQYGQPIYAQQQPSQMPNMRPYSAQTQQFGTSPQIHQYNQLHRGAPSGGYSKNFPAQHVPHLPVQQNLIPTGPQARPLEVGDETK